MKKGRRKGVRIQGLVREARDARERLVRGLPLHARGAFLDHVRGVVDRARAICKEAGSTVRSLPAPSRNALAALRKIASLSPEAIPPPRDPDAAKPIRVRGVEGALRRSLDAVAIGPPSDTAGLFDRIAENVRGAEEACRTADSTPAGLPRRSRRAFAMLKWLSHRSHFDRYLRQAETARTELAGAARGGRAVDRIELRFLAGDFIYQVKREETVHAWRLGLGFLEAGPEDFRDLARVVRAGKRAPKEVRERYDRFVHAPEFCRLDRVLDSLVEGTRYVPRGRAFDLEVLFRSLNERFFESALEKPSLHWGSTASRTLFAHYTEWLDLVTMNALLDDPRLPRCVPEAVLYHELLHKKHGASLRRGRRVWHTRAFRAEERRYPHLEEAKRWLDALSRGDRPPGEKPERKGKPRQLRLPF
ncbi:MAG: hypothetical protein ACYS47_09220 [Planctomycetota bacterium]|jgi:hypothetical protein